MLILLFCEASLCRIALGLDSPMPSTLRQASNPFKNHVGGFLVPWQVPDWAGLIAAGSA